MSFFDDYEAEGEEPEYPDEYEEEYEGEDSSDEEEDEEDEVEELNVDDDGVPRSRRYLRNADFYESGVYTDDYE